MKRVLSVIALCAVAGAAASQSAPQPSSVTGTPGMGTVPPAATGTPMTTPRSNETADDAYNTLDRNHRGYLTREDVQSIQGFSFEAADTNKDGRLSREEFARAWDSQYPNSPFTAK